MTTNQLTGNTPEGNITRNLQKVLDFFSDPLHWTKFTSWRHKDGSRTWAKEDAFSCCLGGACWKVADSYEDGQQLWIKLGDYCSVLHGCCLADFNDRFSTTHNDVLIFLDSAKKHLEQN